MEADKESPHNPSQNQTSHMKNSLAHEMGRVAPFVILATGTKLTLTEGEVKVGGQMRAKYRVFQVLKPWEAVVYIYHWGEFRLPITTATSTVKLICFRKHW